MPAFPDGARAPGGQAMGMRHAPPQPCQRHEKTLPAPPCPGRPPFPHTLHALPAGTSMELRQLEHFVTTADFGSTRRAAETLYTSQSSVSKNISMLEEELQPRCFPDGGGQGILRPGPHRAAERPPHEADGTAEKIQENQHILLSIHHDLTAVLLFVQHHKP